MIHPSLESLSRRLRIIKPKRARNKDASFLDPKELEALLKQPNPRSSDGFRDLSILAYLYNTGARAQEVADTRLTWFDFPSHTVKILGKGLRERTTPLWPSTVQLLTAYQNNHRRRPVPAANDHFFINQRGGAFTRFGVRSLVKKYFALAAKTCPSLKDKRLSTHSLRHTTANHLADSKVDPTGVKNWLGHARLSSSSRYLNTDLNQKRKILERFGPPPLCAEPDPPAAG
jgi:site-specific recombinase XerD